MSYGMFGDDTQLHIALNVLVYFELVCLCACCVLHVNVFGLITCTTRAIHIIHNQVVSIAFCGKS